ncbi:hypothetical protein C9374_009656 [Naegleria lovaniensis]|uniref:Uncharacterized protein n=1 Tax=Naegleria lovaniensis TaxID=51637 RepID=A0AA88H3N9_NAELO|nr:uncharacterized protein C9374_009656 [Naegleria lovaniensis]KAG2393079.1 hypothetical protein C9374_009656 [Naegleria lovaniensis]
MRKTSSSPSQLVVLLGVFFVLLCIYFPFVRSATKVDCTKTCAPGVDPLTGVQSSCKKNQATKVVIELSNSNETSTFYPFCVLVDELAEIILNGSSIFMNVSENSTVTVWVGNTKSESVYFRSLKSISGRDSFTLYYTIAVTLDGGLVNQTSILNRQPIEFIDNCDAAKEQCSVDISLPCVRQRQCGQYFDQASNTDVKIFVSWTGTDNTGTPLRSYGLLPSNFRFLAFENYFSSFKNLLTPKEN